MVKKALVIGINYTGSQHALRGCINDAWNVANFLVNHWGYQPGDILVLTDDPTSKPIGGTRVSTTREEHAETHAAEHHEAEPEKKKKDKKDKKDKKKKDEAHEESDEKKDKKKEKKDKKDKKDKKKDKTRDISPEELQALDDSYAAATRDINEEEVITRGATSATFLRGKCDRAGILEGIHYLTNNLSAGDHLFLHYSGHGTQVADRTGDESDGKDEAICPLDFQTAGVIVDDDLNRLLVAPLPAGVRLTALMDCCHSGTALDLSYRYEAKDDAELKVDKKKKKSKPKKEKKVGKKSKSDADYPLVVMLSGCEDHQVSADVVLDGSATGAVSFSVVSALTQHNFDMSFADLLASIKVILKARVKNIQYPVLTTNVPEFDFAQKFVA